MFEPNKEQLEWREKIIAFAKEHINPKAVDRDQQAHFDPALWKQCGQAGLTGLCLSTDYGGQGMDAFSTVLALEALGYGSEDPGLNFAIAAHLLAVTVPIQQFGSADQKKHWLPSLAQGDLIGGNAITETSAGSDVFNMQTSAESSESGYLLNGTKTYCTNGQYAGLILTYAMTQPTKGFFGGVSAFVLENGKHDFTWSEEKQKLGLRTCSLAEIAFSDTKVLAENRLGQEGAGGRIFNHSMAWERTCLGAIHLGAMDRLLTLATAFANQRYSGGENLSSKQGVTHPFADLKAQLEGARLLTYQAAQQLDAGKSNNTYTPLAKLSVSECYRNVCLQLMQLFAGKAYQTPHPVELQLRAALGATIYSGTSEIQREIIARKMGFKPKQQQST